MSTNPTAPPHTYLPPVVQPVYTPPPPQQQQPPVYSAVYSSSAQQSSVYSPPLQQQQQYQQQQQQYQQQQQQYQQQQQQPYGYNSTSYYVPPPPSQQQVVYVDQKRQSEPDEDHAWISIMIYVIVLLVNLCCGFGLSFLFLIGCIYWKSRNSTARTMAKISLLTFIATAALWIVLFLLIAGSILLMVLVYVVYLVFMLVIFACAFH